MATKTELDAAYRATTYRVYSPDGALELRVGEVSAALRDWLAELGEDCWAILTAANPRSMPLSASANAERQSQLECDLLEGGYETFLVENIADAADWPVEESCFVPGLAEEDALALAEDYAQNAILAGGADGMVRLVWLASGGE